MSRTTPRTAAQVALLLAVGLLVACGGPPARARRETRSGGDSVDMESEAPASDAASPDVAPVVQVMATESTTASGSAAGAAYVDPPNLTVPPPRERSPLALIGYALVPDRATHVLLATLELPPGERFVPPVSSCQDVLVYLADGCLDASGTGIGSVDAPATLYPGDAVRFGPEGDGLVVNSSAETVRTIVAIARQEDAGPARTAPEERSDRLQCAVDRSRDPLVAPLRLASYETTAPIHLGATGLDVRILLDADAAGAEHAGLAVLTGSPDARVLEHVHDAAAEVLYVEDGDGTMRIGERTVDVRPGVSVYVPAGTPHSFEPTGRRPLRVLQFYAPSGPEQRFRGTGP